jgi:hypothetical protein
MKRKTSALVATNAHVLRGQLEFEFQSSTKVKQIGLTQQRLRELLMYDPETGIFTWRVRRGGTANAGTVAGSTDTTGHLQIKIDGKLYLAHRLVWLYVHGYWPSLEIDHRDGEKQNNRLKNLRLATSADNSRNTPAKNTNTSGIKGVSWFKGRWVAQINVSGKKFYLGRFVEKESAGLAYAEAAHRYHGEFARVA